MQLRFNEKCDKQGKTHLAHLAALACATVTDSHFLSPEHPTAQNARSTICNRLPPNGNLNPLTKAS